MSQPIPLPPFQAFLASNLPSVYDNTLSYYEELVKMIAYLEQVVVPAVNDTASQISGLQESFNQLKSYVEHYFDNLDVQEEINNKLDEMAEQGQLATIIAQFLAVAPVFAYGTIAEMAATENLNDGCIARVLGNTTASDGDGAYYMVRTRIESDDPDGVNLVAVGDTLVAARVQDAAINKVEQDISDLSDAIDVKYNRADNIALQNYLIYDMDSSLYSQGSNMDENGNIYVYAGENETGRIFVFSNTTETLANTISVDLGHGSSLVKKGGYIYAAPGTAGRNLYKYNISNGTKTADSTFATETQYDCVLAVSDYSDDKILVTLGSTNTFQLATSVCPCVYDLNAGTYTKITMTNSKNFKINMFYAIQCVSYYNNHIYVLCSEPNCILDFYVDGDTADLQKIYRIPRRDLFGLTIGEVEAISNVPGTDTFLLTAHVKENQKISKRSIKMYFFSFDTELPQLYKNRLVTENQSYFDLCYLDNSQTSLYEDGSETYPFKTFTRAIECATHSDYYTGNQIMMKSGTYEIGRINSAVGILNLYDENTIVAINGYTEISNSNIQIKVRSGALTFNGQIDIDDNSIFNTFGGMVTFKNTIEASMNSRVSIEQALLDYTGTTAQVVARASATLNIGISENSTATGASYLFRLSSNAVLITNSEGTMQTFDMTDIGDAWTRIQAGMHSADS